MVVATRLKHIKLAISSWAKQILRIHAMQSNPVTNFCYPMNFLGFSFPKQGWKQQNTVLHHLGCKKKL